MVFYVEPRLSLTKLLFSNKLFYVSKSLLAPSGNSTVACGIPQRVLSHSCKSSRFSKL